MNAHVQNMRTRSKSPNVSKVQLKISSAITNAGPVDNFESQVVLDQAFSSRFGREYSNNNISNVFVKDQKPKRELINY